MKDMSILMDKSIRNKETGETRKVISIDEATRKLDTRSADVDRFFTEFCNRPIIEEVPTPKEIMPAMIMPNLTFSLSGSFSAEMVLAILEKNIPAGQACKISVAVEVALPEQP